MEGWKDETKPCSHRFPALDGGHLRDKHTQLYGSKSKPTNNIGIFICYICKYSQLATYQILVRREKKGVSHILLGAVYKRDTILATI